jgi:hypothetical protein
MKTFFCSPHRAKIAEEPYTVQKRCKQDQSSYYWSRTCEGSQRDTGRGGKPEQKVLRPAATVPPQVTSAVMTTPSAKTRSLLEFAYLNHDDVVALFSLLKKRRSLARTFENIPHSDDF